jgi:hypothetical protein
MHVDIDRQKNHGIHFHIPAKVLRISVVASPALCLPFSSSFASRLPIYYEVGKSNKTSYIQES